MTITAVVRALVAAGATPEMILAAVEAAESEQLAAIERRRAADAERQRRRRHGLSRDVLVTSCDTPSSPPLPPTPPNTPPISPQTTPDEARGAAPVPGPISEPDFETLGRELAAAGGKALVNPVTAPGLLVLSDPMNWIRNGCDLKADILPAVRARCSRARPSSIRSWNYFTEAVYQARDSRLKPAPEPDYERQAVPPHRPAKRSHDSMLAAYASLAARSGGHDGIDGDYPSGLDDGRTVDLVANPH